MNDYSTTKALIAMSGGVDSSVAAFLMKNRGYDCIGCMMKLYSPDTDVTSEGRTCCTLDDSEDARAVCRRLGIPFYVFNFEKEFREQVIGNFISCYELARTPNPCIVCNRCLKFGRLLERAKALGCSFLVTGHYARIEHSGNKYILKKALDPAKDQSYVLYSLTQEQLSHIIFPLGETSKDITRAIAAENGFVNADKPDSQDICFVPDGDYASVIEKYTSKKYPPGDFVNGAGEVLGSHKGIIHYTIGQRRGLGISAKDRLFVLKICPESNTVVLGSNNDLFSKEVNVREFNWISGEVPDSPVRCAAKIRYRHKEQPAYACPLENGRVKIIFDEPQRAITPGQSAVLYDGDTVLGGGIIE